MDLQRREEKREGRGGDSPIGTFSARADPDPGFNHGPPNSVEHVSKTHTSRSVLPTKHMPLQAFKKKTSTPQTQQQDRILNLASRIVSPTLLNICQKLIHLEYKITNITKQTCHFKRSGNWFSNKHVTRCA